MESRQYKKPTIIHSDAGRAIFPAVALAFATGVGLALSKGNHYIDSNHTGKLTERKDFKFEG